jgi:hypothetical protein
MEEGWRLLSNLVGYSEAEVSVGMEIEAVFQRTSSGQNVPLFVPVRPPQG